MTDESPKKERKKRSPNVGFTTEEELNPELYRLDEEGIWSVPYGHHLKVYCCGRKGNKYHSSILRNSIGDRSLTTRIKLYQFRPDLLASYSL